MYYVWEKALNLHRQYAYVTDPPTGFRAKHWISGEEMASPPKIELTGDSDSPTTLSDVLLTGFPLAVFSPRLMALLDKVGAHNVQYLPIAIVNHDTKEKEASYRIANILGAIECVDLTHADYDRSEESGTILRMDSFRIIPEKVVSPVIDGPPLLFRLAEFKRHILVHERVKQACEEAGITGVKFVEPEERV